MRRSKSSALSGELWKNSGIRKTVTVYSGSRFYSEAEIAASIIKENTIDQMNSGACRRVDKANEQRELSEEELERFRICCDLKKYYTRNSFLRSLYFRSKRSKLTIPQMKAIKRTIDKFKEHDRELEQEPVSKDNPNNWEW